MAGQDPAGEGGRLAAFLRERARELQGGGDLLDRLSAVARAGSAPGELGRASSELREAVFELVERGEVPAAEARLLSRELDEIVRGALERADEPSRALMTLDRALHQGLGDLARLALEGSASADNAVLLVLQGDQLISAGAEGLSPEEAARVGASGTPSAEALARRRPLHLRHAVRHPLAAAERIAGTRAVYAVPVVRGETVLGVVRVGTRTAFRFDVHELRLFRGLAARAAALLAGDVAAADARIRHALRTFENLIEAAPLPIVSVDLAGIVRIWNRAAEQCFGWKREDVLGRSNPTVPPDQIDDARELFAEVHGGSIVMGREVRRVRRDGEAIDLAVSAAPLHDSAGAVTGSIAILLDISARKRADAEVQRTAHFREHLIGIVGHDLRNPLTAITSSAQLLLRYGRLDEKQSRVLQRINSSGQRMARMIDDLLDFTRAHLGGEFPIHPRRMDLGELCEHTVEELSLAYPDRGVDLQAEGDLWGDWDADRMAQVISNLVGNALQHSPEGTPVIVRVRDEGDFVALETRNAGSPIPAEVLAHVFEPGRRGDGVRSRGLGLGLYIVLQIVRAHGGTIEAKSDEQIGTVFTARLPRRARHKA